MLSAIGLDPDDVEWRDLALCQNTDTNSFYEEYEANEQVAKTVDDVCLSCPVMAQCLREGIENNEYGVWGGVYLHAGKPDPARNSHKTADIADILKERLSGTDFLH